MGASPIAALFYKAGMAKYGRRKGLKIPRPFGHAGSIPAPGSRYENFGSLAQLVEHRIFNPVAAGPSPARPISFFYGGINGI